MVLARRRVQRRAPGRRAVTCGRPFSSKEERLVCDACGPRSGPTTVNDTTTLETRAV